jgi:hypothetical protein
MQVRVTLGVKMAKRKNAAAVELGRKGGTAKVPKGFATMDAERHAEAMKKSLETRRAAKKAVKK